MEATSATSGQYAVTTSAFALSALTVLYLEDNFGSGLLLLLFLACAFAYAVTLIVLLSIFLWRFFTGTFRSAVPALLGLVILASAPFFTSQVFWFCDLVRLASSYAYYRAVIDQTGPNAEGNKSVEIGWGGGGFVPTTWDTYLIYIEGPDPKLPVVPEGCSAGDRHIIGGFYSRKITC